MRNLDCLNELKRFLSAGGVVSAAAEAEALFLHFGKMDRAEFYADIKTISPRTLQKIRGFARKRIGGTPLQYLTGETDFYGRTFFVGPGALIPRPETEILVQTALDLLEGLQNPQILDIGTGSGCIAVSLTIARPDCRMTALDCSAQALNWARKNARFHAVSDRIIFGKSDLWKTFGGKQIFFWDLIVSNPPYIPRSQMTKLPKDVQREPRLALDGGKKGLDTIARIIHGAPSYLKTGGRILMEVGDGQAASVEALFKNRGCYRRIRSIKDYNGVKRVVVAENQRASWIS